MTVLTEKQNSVTAIKLVHFPVTASQRQYRVGERRARLGDRARDDVGGRVQQLPRERALHRKVGDDDAVARVLTPAPTAPQVKTSKVVQVFLGGPGGRGLCREFYVLTCAQHFDEEF